MLLPACELVGFDGTTLRRVGGGTEGAGVLVVVTYSFACPYARAYDARLVALAAKYEGARFLLSVCSDAARYPEDHAPGLIAPSPRIELVRDTSEAFSRALGARTTAEAFVFDAKHALAYRGRIDDAPFHAASVREPYLERAIAAALRGEHSPPGPAPLGTPIAFR